MTFQEIFNQDGLYVGDNFRQGVCFEIKDGMLYIKTYANADDINPSVAPALVYRGLFHKRYVKVFTRQSLFK